MMLSPDFDTDAAARRASSSYMLGWTDALMWAINNRKVIDRFFFEILAGPEDGPRRGELMRSVVMQASDLYDLHGADPRAWMEVQASLMEVLVEIGPDLEHWSSLADLTNDELRAAVATRHEEIRRRLEELRS